MTDKRYKEIIRQLIKIIHILCKEHGKNVDDMIDNYTNLTENEKNSIHIKESR